jgi:hypothetical protein
MLATFYETARGDRPVEEFIDSLSAKEAAKVLDALAAIEAHGLEVVVTRQLKGKLWELKVSATRIFYVMVTAPEVEEAGPESPAEGDRDGRAADGGSAGSSSLTCRNSNRARRP